MAPINSSFYFRRGGGGDNCLSLWLKVAFVKKCRIRIKYDVFRGQYYGPRLCLNRALYSLASFLCLVLGAELMKPD